MKSKLHAHSASRRTLLRATAALGLLGLAPQSRACEYFTTTLRVTHPWTRATTPGANSAILITRFDEVTQPDRLIAVETPVAGRAELVTGSRAGEIDLEIPQGILTELSEDGTYIRLLDLAHPLKLGRSYPLLLTFENGGIADATLNVDYGGGSFSSIRGFR
ncbi:copper chaperone PCu(A)C [Azoarcus sp. L1K30]|uniref:copper chaperone PCu(A)C n=1 Tax=Azoarcus sp. L1K30 TaxID=2820277 RepID=UPI001B8198D0|nr:copper chaperone PCu(A)C [Azoarcus sp. L1K30]MBR0566852.1 copper chaperone PCu(A)C [Azoarcus sp. L1K30]